MDKDVTIMSVFKCKRLEKTSQVCAMGEQRAVSIFLFSQFSRIREPPNEDAEILLHWQDQIVSPNTPNYLCVSINICTCKKNWWQN